MITQPRFADLILFENDNLIVVNKPPFIATLEDRSSPINLLQMARKYALDAQACHRLDKETSGVIIFAKNPEAYRHIAIQLEKRKVQKIYHAIVEGNASFDHLLIDLPIKQTTTGTVRIDFKEGKEAKTEFHTLKTFQHYQLVECKLYSGRMHQIRIHLASQNASIAADEMYKGEKPMLSKLKSKFRLGKYAKEQPIIDRVALHAYSVSFEDLSGEIITAVAPYPKDMEVFLKILDKYDSQ